jgi:hypothetical protein
MRLLATLLCLTSSCAQAQELAAVCKYSYSVDDSGTRSSTSGQFSMKAIYMLPVGNPLNVQLRTTKAPCLDFLATGDDMVIQGGCIRMLQTNLKVIHRFTFDRVSGAFQESVSFNDKGELTHYGTCVSAKPLF